MAREREHDDEEEEEDLFPEGSECHGLFLPEEAKDNPVAASAIARISVKRIHPWEETGMQTYSPTELRSPQDLHERWGGGLYQVTARRHDGTILPGCTRKHRLEGQAFAFSPGARQRAEAAAQAQAVQTETAVAPAKAADPTIALMMATLERMSAESNAARKEASDLVVKALDALVQRQTATPVAQASAPVGDEKSADHFRAGMDYAFSQMTDWSEKTKKSGGEEGNGSDDNELVKSVVEGIKAVKGLDT